MIREISAGGVVVREIEGVWRIALIEPQKDDSGEAKKGKPSRAVLCLPKGLVDAGESAEAAAIREVREETGLVAETVSKLVDTRYVYVRTWGDGERVFKIVSFYLMKYVSGNIGEIAEDMRIEVKRAVWIPLADATKHMAHGGERKVVALAQEHLAERGLQPKKSVPRGKSAARRYHKDV